MREIGAPNVGAAGRSRRVARGITLIRLSEAHFARLAPHERDRSVHTRDTPIWRHAIQVLLVISGDLAS